VASADEIKGPKLANVKSRISNNMKKVATPFRMMKEGVKRAGGSVKNTMSGRKKPGAPGTARRLALDVKVFEARRLDSLLDDDDLDKKAATGSKTASGGKGSGADGGDDDDDDDEADEDGTRGHRFYIEATYGDASRVTRIADPGADPAWGEILSFALREGGRDDLKLLVYAIPPGGGPAPPVQQANDDDCSTPTKDQAGGQQDGPEPVYLGGVIIKPPATPQETEARWHDIFCGTTSSAQLRISLAIRWGMPKTPGALIAASASSTAVADTGPASAAAAAAASTSLSSASSASSSSTSSLSQLGPAGSPRGPATSDASEADSNAEDGQGPELENAHDGDSHFIVVDEEVPLDDLGGASMWGATSVTRAPRETGLGFQIAVINMRRKGRDYLFDVQVVTHQNSMWIVSRRHKDFAALAKAVAKRKIAFLRVPSKSEVESDDPDAWVPLEDLLISIMSDPQRLAENKAIGLVSKFLQS
jgi:hypothetical protein